MIVNTDVLNVGQRCAFAQPTKPVSGQALELFINIFTVIYQYMVLRGLLWS